MLQQQPKPSHPINMGDLLSTDPDYDLNIAHIGRDSSGQIYIIDSSGALVEPNEVAPLIILFQEYVDTVDPQFVEENNELLMQQRNGRARASQPLPPKRAPRMSNVYLMLNKRNGYYKIGLADKPAFREKTLQSEEPDVQLIWSHLGTIQEEATLHEMFKTKRIRGEWFSLTPEDVETIKSIFREGTDHNTSNPETPQP